MTDSRGAGFRVELPLTRMWKDDSGLMRFEGVASSTARDKQRERMTPEAISKMAAYQGIDLLPSHDAGPLASGCSRRFSRGSAISSALAGE